jgi:hypothetical protein
MGNTFMLNGVFWAYALTVLLLSGLGLGFQDIQKIQKIFTRSLSNQKLEVKVRIANF